MLASTAAQRIDELDLFAECTRAQLDRIGSLTTQLTIPAGQVLINEGGTGMEFIVILRGTARVTQRTADGDTVVADVGRGDFLGEMALLSKSRRTATVTATSDLVVLVSSVGEFRSILETAPSVARTIRQVSFARASNMVAAA